MGDLLVHGSMEARSVSFNYNCLKILLVTQQMCMCCSPRRRTRPLSISTPKRRLCNNLLSCSNNDSSSVDLQIVSTTECYDGSVLYRFGDWKEIERNVKVEESAAAAAHSTANVGKVSGKIEKESNHVSKKEVKYNYSKTDPDQFIDIALHRQDTRSVLNSDSELVAALSDGRLESNERLLEGTVLDIKTSDLLGSQTNVHSEDVSNEKANSEILGSVTVSEHDVKQDKNSSPFESDSGRNGHNKVNSLSVDSKSNIVSDVQKVSASLEVLQDKGAGEITQFAASRSEFEIESPNSYASQESNKEGQNIEITYVTTVAEEHNMDTEPNHVTGENGMEGNVTEVMPKFISLEADPVLDEKTTQNSMDEFVDPNRTMRSELLDGSVHSSVKEEVTKFDTLSSNTPEVLVSYVQESQIIGASLNREEKLTKGLFLSSGAALFAHPSKALIGKADAYFVACQNWLGVADGIGQWSFEGIRAGLYAQELMRNCIKIVSESKSFPITDPVAILKRSAAETQSPGYSTILVSYFDGQALLVANIGDSGFIIIRNGTVFNRSSPMVHEFNFPVQFENGDDPSELAEEYKINLDEGDVLITATDGLFDNLYEQEIVSIISSALQNGLKPQEIAESLAARAQEVGKSGSARSPFADAAQAAGYVGYRGGKLDDVAVIVSLVQIEDT